MSINSTDSKKLFKSVNSFVFILSLDMNVIDCNNTVSDVLLFHHDHLIGKNILSLFSLENRDKAQQILSEMIEGSTAICTLPLVSAQGISIPVETKIHQGKWNNEDAHILVSKNLYETPVLDESFQVIFDNNQLLMAISEIDSGVLIDVNRRFLDRLAYKKSELLGKSLWQFNLFYDDLEPNDFIEKMNALASISNEYIVMRTKEGKPFHALFSMTPIKMHAHYYVLTSAIDISLLKASEEKLKKSLYQQTLLADISQNFLTVDNLSEKVNHTLSLLGKHTEVSRVYIFQDNSAGTETSNTYEWCNEGISPQMQELQDIPYEIIPSWKEILEKNGKLLSNNIKELPDDILSVLEPQAIQSILVFPLFVQNHFFGFIGFDECIKEKIWEKEEIDLLRTISGIISNSFERQIFQKQLRESEIRQKLAIENTEAGLWDWDVQSGEVYFNDIWWQMLGYARSEIEPNISTWEKLVHPDDMASVMKDLNLHIEGKIDYYENTHRLLTKSGDWKWVSDKGKIIEYDDENKPKRAIGTHIDIDGQKRIEEELRSLNSTKDKFFSIIAHDLRGPIGSMMQISEMVSDQNGLEKETLHMFLDSQKELSKSTFQLLENLLNWARSNLEQIKHSPQVINIKDIIEESILSIKYIAKQKGIHIVFNPSEAFVAYADPDMVKLILRNLLSNALKFTHKEGLIRIELATTVDYIEIKIIDTGQGISEANIERIMSESEFYSTPGTADEKGTGLGLKLCKNFIKQNKGELQLASELNVGTTISFTLPLVKT